LETKVFVKKDLFLAEIVDLAQTIGINITVRQKLQMCKLRTGFLSKKWPEPSQASTNCVS